MIRLTSICSLFLLLHFVLSSTFGQEEPRPKAGVSRFGFNLDVMTYPQKSPQDTMKSIALALSRKRVDYMLAHIVDPDYVDYWVERYKKDYTQGSDKARQLLAFDRLVEETNQYYLNEPLVLKELRIFIKEGEWEEKEDIAVGTAKSLPARKMFLRRNGDRWFLENRQQ
jgi:hypothetical protein